MVETSAPQAAAAQEAAPEGHPIIQLSAKWRVRDDREQWVLQRLIEGKRPYWEARSFWTYRAWLLRAIAEAEILADEGGLVPIRSLPPAHPSRGLSASFDVDAFVRAVNEGRLDPLGLIADRPTKPPADVVETINWYRAYWAAWIATHSLPKP